VNNPVQIDSLMINFEVQLISFVLGGSLWVFGGDLRKGFER
jgi:hypothetical protein